MKPETGKRGIGESGKGKRFLLFSVSPRLRFSDSSSSSPFPRFTVSSSSIPHQSAIDVERLAGDVIGLSRGQEGGHVGDVVRGIRAPQRDRDVHARGGLFFGNPFTLGDLLHDAFVHTGASCARADGIDVNVIFSELRRADAGHGDYR